MAIDTLQKNDVEYPIVLAGVLKPSGTVVNISAEALRVADIEPVNVHGRPIWECIWWRHSSHASTQVKAAIAQAGRGETVRLETTIGGLSSTPVGGVVEFLPALDDQGRVAHILFSSVLASGDPLHPEAEDLRFALEDAHIGTWSMDITTGKVHRSDEIRLIYGFDDYTPRTIQSWLDRIHADDRARVLAELEARLTSTETKFSQDFRIVHPERGVRWILDLGRICRDSDGKALRLDGFSVDVTDQKRAELERDRFFELSLDMMIVGSIHESVWKRVNPAVLRTLGWSAEELSSMPLTALVHPDDVPQTREAGGVLASGRPLTKFEHRLRCKDGSYKWISWNATPYPNEDLVYSIGSDTTARKQAEHALQESESRFREMAECMPHCVWVTDAGGQAVYANRAWHEFTGLPRGSAVGETWLAQYHADDRAHLVREWTKALRSDGQHAYDIEARIRRHDGEHRWFRIKGAPIKSAAGQTLLWVGTCTDTHEQRHLVDELRLSEARYRAVVESQTEMVCRFRLDGTILFANTAYAETFDTTPEALINANFWDIILEEDRAHVRALLASLTPESPEVQIDNRVETAEGPRWTLWINRVIEFDAEGHATEAQSTGIDITSRRRAELALQQARDELEVRVAERTRELQRRAEQLARLTTELTLTEQRERRRLAHLLHDHLQQLLVGAKIHLDLLSLPSAEQPGQGLAGVNALINEAIQASRSLTVELAPPILHEAGLAAGFEWLARWNREKHGLNIELHVIENARIKQEDVRILLFQSVRELLFNVVKHSGVRQARVDVSLPDAEHIEVTVSDRGQGFNPKAARTPGAGEETGLGLFSINERLTLLGGSLRIHSASGEGTRATVSIPITVEAVRKGGSGTDHST